MVAVGTDFLECEDGGVSRPQPADGLASQKKNAAYLPLAVAFVLSVGMGYSVLGPFVAAHAHGDVLHLNHQQPLHKAAFVPQLTGRLARHSAPVTANKIAMSDVQPEAEIQKGKVKSFNNDRGYGFLTVEGRDGDLYVHQSDIRAQGFRSLAVGEDVEFKMGTDPKSGKPAAVEVTGPEGNYVQGGRRRRKSRKRGPKQEQHEDDGNEHDATRNDDDSKDADLAANVGNVREKMGVFELLQNMLETSTDSSLASSKRDAPVQIDKTTEGKRDGAIGNDDASKDADLAAVVEDFGEQRDLLERAITKLRGKIEELEGKNDDTTGTVEEQRGLHERAITMLQDKIDKLEGENDDTTGTDGNSEGAKALQGLTGKLEVENDDATRNDDGSKDADLAASVGNVKEQKGLFELFKDFLR